jgi:hypothetical protein
MNPSLRNSTLNKRCRYPGLMRVEDVGTRQRQPATSPINGADRLAAVHDEGCTAAAFAGALVLVGWAQWIDASCLDARRPELIATSVGS